MHAKVGKLEVKMTSIFKQSKGEGSLVLASSCSNSKTINDLLILCVCTTILAL